MRDLKAEENTLETKLKSERRTCPECKLEVLNPFVERCPRCFNLLPQMALECDGCIHRITCPVAHERS